MERASALAKTVSLLEGADEVCLACHVRPDADALGSMLALAHALRTPGRRPQRVIASFGDQPFEVPEILRFLPGLDLLSPPGAVPGRPELMITFDAGSIDRLGPAGRPAAGPGSWWSSTITRPTPGSARSTWWTRPQRPPPSWSLRPDRPHGHRADRATSRSACTPGWSPTPARSSSPPPPRPCTRWRPGCSARGSNRARWPGNCGTGPRSATWACFRRAGPGRAEAGRRGRSRPGVDHGQLC